MPLPPIPSCFIEAQGTSFGCRTGAGITCDEVFAGPRGESCGLHPPPVALAAALCGGRRALVHPALPRHHAGHSRSPDLPPRRYHWRPSLRPEAAVGPFRSASEFQSPAGASE